MFHLKRKRASFFLWGELRGALFLFLAYEAAVCNSLQLFAQWRENIQSFHPWLRHHGLDRPHALCFSQSLSNSWAQVKWELHLRQPRLSDYEWLCIIAILTRFHNIFGLLDLAYYYISTTIMIHRWAGQSSQLEKLISIITSEGIRWLNCFSI